MRCKHMHIQAHKQQRKGFSSFYSWSYIIKEVVENKACWCGGSYACISMCEQGVSVGSIPRLCNVFFAHERQCRAVPPSQ